MGNDEFYTTDKFSRIKFGHDAADKSIMTTNMFDVFGNYGPNDIGMKTDIPIPTERMEIELPQVLQKYEGKYDFGGGFLLRFLLRITNYSDKQQAKVLLKCLQKMKQNSF